MGGPPVPTLVGGRVHGVTVVEVPIAVLPDRGEAWGCEHVRIGPDVAGIPAAEWLDMTAMHIPLIPFVQRRYLHQLESLTAKGVRLNVSGTTVDYDGGLAGADQLELRLVNAETGRVAGAIPARARSIIDRGLVWLMKPSPADAVRSAGKPG